MRLHVNLIEKMIESSQVAELYVYLMIKTQSSHSSGFSEDKYRPGQFCCSRFLLFRSIANLKKQGLIQENGEKLFLPSHYRVAATMFGTGSHAFIDIPIEEFKTMTEFKAYIYALAGRLFQKKLQTSRFKSRVDLKDKAYHKTNDVTNNRGQVDNGIQYSLGLASSYLGVSEKTVWKYRNKAKEMGYVKITPVLEHITNDRDNFFDWLRFHPEYARRTVVKYGLGTKSYWMLLGYNQDFSDIKIKRRKVQSGVTRPDGSIYLGNMYIIEEKERKSTVSLCSIPAPV
jgi:hypothetical protein